MATVRVKEARLSEKENDRGQGIFIGVKERNGVSERSDPAANFGCGTVDIDPFFKDILDLNANRSGSGSKYGSI